MITGQTKLHFLVFLLCVVNLLLTSPALAVCTPSFVLILSPDVGGTGLSFSTSGIAMFSDTTTPRTVSALLDGTQIGSMDCPVSSFACAFSFPTNALPGTHTISVAAACSGSTKSGSVTFQSTGPGNTITPALTIVSPAEKSSVPPTFPITVNIHYQDRSIINNGNDWGIVMATIAPTDGSSAGTSTMPMFCSTQDCTLNFTGTADVGVPTTLTVETTPIIAGVYNLPTASQSVHLNIVPATDPNWYDINPDSFPREDPGVVCTDQCYASTINVINGRVQFPIKAFDAGNSPLATRLSFFYDSEDLDGSTMQALALPYRQPLGKGWDYTYNISLFKNQTGGTMVMRGGGLPKHFYTPNQDGSYTARTGDQSTLTKLVDGSYVVKFREGKQYRFTSAGALSALQDRFGNVVTVTDHRNDTIPTNTITITDPALRIITLNIDPVNHLITSFVDPAGSTYGIIYTTAKQINRLTLPASVGQATSPYWQFSYNAQFTLDSKVDPNGNTTTYSYDAQGRALSATSLGTITRGASYLPGNTTLVGETGGNTTFTYSTDHVITGIVDPVGVTATYTYNAAGLLGTEIMPVDAQTVYVWAYQYDAYGNKTDIQGHTRHLGTTLSDDPIDYHLGITYDTNHFDQVSGIINYLDVPPTTTSLAYDTNAGYQRISATSPTGGMTVTRLETNGNTHDIAHSDGTVTSFQYDTKGQLASTTTSGIKTVFADYDALGNAHTVRLYDAAGTLVQTRLYEFDAVGRPTKDTVPATVPYIASYRYDLNGNPREVTDANSKKTTFEYDFKGQTTKITDALNKSTCFQYVGNGSLTTVIDANGNSTRYEYDMAERLVREVPATGSPLRYEYNQAGRLWKQKNDLTGITLVTFTYDAQGRLVRKDFQDGSWDSYSFTPGGQLQTAANQDSSYRFDYYASGLIRTVTDGVGRKVDYAYDTAGRRNKLTVLTGTLNEHTVSYVYTLDKLTSIDSSLAGAFGLGYDVLGRRATLTYPNGIVGTYTYHAEQPTWLTGISYVGMLSPYSVMYPSFDMVGNRMAKSDEISSLFTYDDVYRLKSATGTGESYTYDSVGNRRSGPKTTDSYTYGADNQLLTGPRANYGYDVYGNLQTAGIWAYTWNLENKLVKATNGPVTVSFKYDVFGRRVSKTLEIYKFKRSSTYLYDGEDVVVEYVDGVIGNQYIHGSEVDEHLGLVAGVKSYFYHADGLGSTTRITDSTKKVVQRYGYDSFGQLISSVGSFDQPYTYTGRELDREMKLYYYRARYYDPAIGRFVSRDPIGAAGGINFYRYTGGNPNNWRDPSGLAQFENAIELRKFAEAAMSNKQFVPRNGQTFCNRGVNYIEQAGDNYDYKNLLANDIVKKLDNPKYATQITPEQAINYAKNGTTVIAGVIENTHGHVAIVSPTDPTTQKGWGTLPYLFNIGKTNGEIPVNEVFRKDNKPKYYIRNEDM